MATQRSELYQETSPVQDVSIGWTQIPPESTCGINIKLTVDLERSSNGNIDGLELDESVEEATI